MIGDDNRHPVCDAIDVCEHLSFCLGSAVMLLWDRCYGDGDRSKQDLSKIRTAVSYLARAVNAPNAGEGMAFPAETWVLLRVLAKNAATPLVLAEMFEMGAKANSVRDVCFEAYETIRKMHKQIDVENGKQDISMIKVMQ